jgi:hypothetical protein
MEDAGVPCVVCRVDRRAKLDRAGPPPSPASVTSNFAPETSFLLTLSTLFPVTLPAPFSFSYRWSESLFVFLTVSAVARRPFASGAPPCLAACRSFAQPSSPSNSSLIRLVFRCRLASSEYSGIRHRLIALSPFDCLNRWHAKDRTAWCSSIVPHRCIAASLTYL